jgi:hypothetical protein
MTGMAGPAPTVCDGRFVLLERRYGAEALGVWEGTEPGAGDRRVLVSVGPFAGDVFDDLELDVPGVPTLLAVGDAPGGGTAAVEEHPAGAVAAPAPEEAAALGLEVAELAAFVHHMGLALGGIRPEAVWRGEEVSISPRLTRLWELSRVGLDAPGGPAVYISLGRLRGTGPTPADDVFALGATLAWWATGAHAFEGETRGEQIRAIHDRRRRPWTGDPALEPIVEAALRPRAERPSMEQLEAALREVAG